jgi:hypothetical protein
MLLAHIGSGQLLCEMGVGRRRIVVAQTALAVADAGFFVALAALCDTENDPLRLAPVYVVAALVFVARCRHYFQFAETVRNYRRARVDLPLPVGEARPTLVAALYSVLTSVVEMTTRTPVSEPTHCVYIVLWSVAVVGNLIHGTVNDDRATLRRFVQRAFAHQKRRRDARQASLQIERVVDKTGDVWGSGLEYQAEGDESSTSLPPSHVHSPPTAAILETSDDDDETISVDEILFDTESQRQRFEPIVAARQKRWKIVVS